jgi:hypothetical protein
MQRLKDYIFEPNYLISNRFPTKTIDNREFGERRVSSNGCAQYRVLTIQLACSVRYLILDAPKWLLQFSKIISKFLDVVLRSVREVKKFFTQAIQSSEYHRNLLNLFFFTNNTCKTKPYDDARTNLYS